MLTRTVFVIIKTYLSIENTEVNSNLAAFTLESDAQIQLESLETAAPNDHTVSYRIDEVPFF